MMQLDRNSDRPLYQQIADAIRQDILQGKYQPGQRLPARLALVEALNVNLATVRSALEQLESEGLVVSRTGSGTYVRQDLHAHLTQTGVTQPAKLRQAVMVIGKTRLTQLRRDMIDILANVACGFEETLGDRFGGLRYVASLEQDTLGDLDRIGLVMINRCPRIDPAVLEQLRQQGTPALHLWTSRDDLFLPSIGHDPHQGIELATRHLLELGYRRLGYIGDMGSNTPVGAKFFAFTNVLHQAGLDFQVKHVRNLTRHPGEAYRAAQDILRKDPPEALVVDADWRALEVATAIRHAGLRMPQDIGLIGHDGIAEAAECEPPLTTVSTPRLDIGREIARQWLAWVDHAQPLHSVTLPAVLVPGSTAGPFVSNGADFPDATDALPVNPT